MKNISLAALMSAAICLSCTEKTKSNPATDKTEGDTLVTTIMADSVTDVQEKEPEVEYSINYAPNPDGIDYGQLIDNTRIPYDGNDPDKRKDCIDSVMANVVYPKPKVEFVCNGTEERAVARRVAKIYDDVLETMNYLSRFNEKDFFELYWSKRLLAQYKKAEELETPVVGAYPYTGCQGHETMHLHKVEVLGLQQDEAKVRVTFGILSRKGIILQEGMLNLLHEHGNWYINDIACEEGMSVRDCIKDILNE